MPSRRTKTLREYWNDAARRNPMFYVDTSLDYDAPDPDAFLATGRRVAAIALDPERATLPGRHLAVEIGCGLGRICAALAESFEHVVGIDIAPEMVRQANEFVTADNVEFRLGDGLTLPGVAAASADLVVTFTVFQHAPSRAIIAANLAEAARVLRPGGVLAMQWNATPGPLRWRLHRIRMGVLARLGKADERGRDAPEFLGTRVPVSVMDRMLADVGLRRVAIADPDTLFTWAWAVREH